MSTFTDPRAAIDYGYDFNFFQKITVNNTTGSFFADCDVLINMKAVSYQTTFQLESGGPIQYSFNGITVHGDLTSGLYSANLIFQNRTISKIWFMGTGVVRIESYAIR